MKKQYKFTAILTVILLIIICATLLAGCSIKFPDDETVLLQAAAQEWKDGTEKTITDNFTVKQLQISVPITVYGASKTFRANFTSGEIVLVRAIKEDKIDVTLSAKNFKVEVDKSLAEYIPNNVNLARLDKVTMDMTMLLTPTKMTVTSIIKNLNLVIDGEKQEITETNELSDANYTQQYINFRTIAAMSIFGNIQSDGNISSESKSYNYTLAAAKVNDEIFRLPKILIDASSSIKLGENKQTIGELLLKYFNTADLTVAVNSFLVPNDMRVTTSLELGDKAYFFKTFSGNYIASGTMSSSTSNKIFDDIIAELKKTDNSGLLNAVALAGGIKVDAKMIISSNMNIDSWAK